MLRRTLECDPARDGKDHLCVFSSSAESGESEDSLKTSYVGDPLVIGFNARYVLDFLKVAGGGNVRFHFKAADAPESFGPVDEWLPRSLEKT